LDMLKGAGREGGCHRLTSTGGLSEMLLLRREGADTMPDEATLGKKKVLEDWLVAALGRKYRKSPSPQLAT